MVFKKWLAVRVIYADDSAEDIDLLPLEELKALRDLADALITVRHLLGKEAEE